jgi:tetratricopeptide (TPR) repeat protein
MRIPRAPFLLSALALAPMAHAQESTATPPAAPAAPAPGAAAPAKASSPEGQRRDPKGIKGISPFWEAIKKGDDAFAARDAEGAIAGYQEAIKADPHNGMGQYRIGEVELSRGKMKEAEESLQAALRFAGENAVLKAKILFVLADIKERQRAFEEETIAWNAYEAHLKAQPAAKGYPASAADRKKRIDEWKKLVADYSAVKDRIKQRLAEGEKQAAESAQSPQNR